MDMFGYFVMVCCDDFDVVVVDFCCMYCVLDFVLLVVIDYQYVCVWLLLCECFVQFDYFVEVILGIDLVDIVDGEWIVWSFVYVSCKSGWCEEGEIGVCWDYCDCGVGVVEFWIGM